MGSSVHCPIHLHTGPGPTVYTTLSAEIIYRAKVQNYLVITATPEKKALEKLNSIRRTQYIAITFK